MAAELASLRARPEFLQQVAAKTGGRLLRWDDLEAFVRGLPRMKVPVQETWVRPVWHQFWVLLLLLALLLGNGDCGVGKDRREFQ